MTLKSTRWIIWIILILTLFVCAYLYGQITTTYDAMGTQRTVLALIIGATGIGSVFVFPSMSQRSAWFAIMVPALIARLLLLPTAPGDDIYRYLWEGKLVKLEVSPYAVAGDDASRISYRDANWQQMNHKDKLTAYPPLALRLFSWFNQIHNSTRTYQVIFLTLDLFLIAILLALLKEGGWPLRWAGFYSFSALSMIGFSAEAHFDILMTLPLIGAIYAYKKQAWTTVALLLGIAVGIKIMVAVVVPLMLWHQRWNWRVWLGFSVALLIPLIPYWNDLPQLGKGILMFGSTSSFNGPIYQIFQHLDQGRHGQSNLIVASCYLILWIVSWFVMKRGNLMSALLMALGGLLIFLPTVHFWYILWVLPLIALRPRASWIVLSFTANLYFLVWTQLHDGPRWGLPLWARLLFWAPFFLTLLYENIHLLTSLRQKKIKPPRNHESPSIGVVIPIYNAGPNLKFCIDSIHAQQHPADELLIVDGGSTDDVSSYLNSISTQNLPTPQLIKGKKGRGSQIKKGVEKLSTDWVIVLHADAQLPPDAIKRLVLCLQQNHDLVGGCFGQRFDNGTPALLIVEILNELRGSLAKTSFGDQAQFFHRETILTHNILTDQPLMEDVEISDRLKSSGFIAYLGAEVTVSASKWRKQGFANRFALIVKYFFRYRLLFWKSASDRKQLSEKLVREYYPSKN